MKKVLALLLIFSGYTRLTAQTSFRFGAELGYAVPKVSEDLYDSWSGDRQQATIEKKFDPSVLVGITGEMNLKRHWRFTAGAQYQKNSQHYHEHRDGMDYRSLSWKSDSYLDQTIHKIGFPVSAGLAFKAGIFSPSLFVGIRPTYIFQGQHSAVFYFDHTVDSLDAVNVFAFNPFQTSAPARHFRGQYFWGIATYVGKSFKFSFTMNTGGEYVYTDGPASCFAYSINTNEYLASISYFFNTPKEKKTTCGIGMD